MTVLLNVRSNISAKQSFHSSVLRLALVLIIYMFSCLSAEDLKVSSLERTPSPWTEMKVMVLNFRATL